MIELVPGDVAWAYLGARSGDAVGALGREQVGRRPIVVVSSLDYLDAVDSLAIVVPVSTRDRGWPNHVALAGPTGLEAPSFALTEQPVTLARERLRRVVGHVDTECLAAIRTYLRDFLDL